MSAHADASSIHSDSQTADGQYELATPLSATWLMPKASLLDQAGHPTPVLAQTDQPADGVTLAPLPYTAQIQTPLPSSTASTLPLRWVYKGCYNDVYPAGRVLSVKQPNNSNLTVQACVWSCYLLGYSISGMELGKQCFCGNAIYYGGALSQWDFDCHFECTGNTKEVCGGENKLSVYSNTTLVTYPSGVTLTPELTTAAPTIAPTFPIPSSRTHVPTIVVAVIGALTGIAVMIALIFYLHRRLRTSRLRMESHVRSLQPAPRTRRISGQIISQEEFMKGDEENSAGFGESRLTLSEGYGSKIGPKSSEIGYSSSILELRDRYERLQRNNPQWANTGWKMTGNYLASPATCLPPQGAPARERPAQPTSSLKRPTCIRTANRTQAKSDSDDERGLKGISTRKNPATAKKGVRFGVNQIREFGRSPVIGQGSEKSTK